MGLNNTGSHFVVCRAQQRLGQRAADVDPQGEETPCVHEYLPDEGSNLALIQVLKIILAST
jgi:hypothetical protein